MKVLAVVPAYNEEGSIESLVADIREELPEADILVVNDGSTDHTARILNEAGVEHLDMPFNMGIGGAVLAGMRYFLEGDYEILVRMDGDGQHPPGEARKLVEAVESGNDMAVGSRYIGEGGDYTSLTRMLGIRMLSNISRYVLGRRFTDNTSGFRSFGRSAVEYLVLDYPHDFPEPEEIYILQKGGYDIVEIPVRMRERTSGITSINMLKTWYFFVKVLLTIFIKYTLGGRR